MSLTERNKMKNNYKNFKGRPKIIGGQVSVTAEECGGNPEKMIRKFTRKVKKEGIIEECRARKYYIKPSAIRAEEKRATHKMIQKENKKKDELINTRPLQRRRPKQRSRR